VVVRREKRGDRERSRRRAARKQEQRKERGEEGPGDVRGLAFSPPPPGLAFVNFEGKPSNLSENHKKS